MLSRNRAVLIFLCLLSVLLMSGLQAFAVQPVITQVTVNFTTNAITIIGMDFITLSAPAVSLGSTSLTVNSYSETEIDAALPASTPAGDYLLTVSFGKNNNTFLTYDLTIGAVGPHFYRRASTGMIIQPGTSGTQVAFCDDPTDIVTGGGYWWDATIPPLGDYFIQRNASCGSFLDTAGPQFCGGNPAGWHVNFVNLSATATPWIQAYVYCVKP
jgi:hypothetical protein